MFRIVAEKPPSIGEVQANQLVEQWLNTHNPWTEDPIPHEIRLVDDPIMDTSRHFRGDLRFEIDDDMTAIRDQMKTDLAGVTSWYRIGYHRCDHDESEADACSWDSLTDYGDVPSEMPAIE